MLVALRRSSTSQRVPPIYGSFVLNQRKLFDRPLGLAGHHEATEALVLVVTAVTAIMLIESFIFLKSEREALMRTLASRLEFSVQKIGDFFTLLRTIDVMLPVCAEGLTLNQAEELLQTWKLHGRG